MLLRRVTAHIKNQNWFAVFLDFLIVVVGVFIGIQVANWNEERQNQAQAASLVERLTQEINEVEIEFLDYIKVHQEILDQRFQFAMTVQQASCSDDSSELISLVLSVGDFPPPRFSLPTAAQALNTGELSIITSTELREEVQKITDEMIFLSRQWQRYIQSIREVEVSVNQISGLAINAARKTPLFSSEPYDIERYQLLSREDLCQNTELIGSLSGLEVLQQIYVAYMLEIQEMIKQYKESLLTYAMSLEKG